MGRSLRLCSSIQSPLPDQDGVPASRVYLPDGPWASLLEFLTQRFPRIPTDILVQRLEKGEIVDAGGVPQTLDAPYRARQWLWYYREVPDEEPLPFELPILYRDDRIVAVDKPHFMASTPGGRYLRHTALLRLRNELCLPDLAPMHRLDRDTAGVLLFSVRPDHRGAYQTLFQARQVSREYEAVAVLPDGREPPSVYRSRLQEIPGRFIVEEAPGDANSETHIEVLRWLDDKGKALLRLTPKTGRKHQLRAHMSALGMPILNDSYYPQMRPQPSNCYERPLQLLARAVEFRDPIDGTLRRFESQRTLAALNCPAKPAGESAGSAL